MGLEVPFDARRGVRALAPWDQYAEERHVIADADPFCGGLLGRLVDDVAPEPPRAPERESMEKGIFDRFFAWLAQALHLW